MIRTLPLPLLLAGCGNPCLDMCQAAEVYLDRCGYGWSTTFADRGWTSIQDCYDAEADASEDEWPACEEEDRGWTDRDCY